MAGRRTRSRGRALALWTALALATAACSVSTPRHGFSTGVRSGGAVPAPGGAAESNGVIAPEGGGAATASGGTAQAADSGSSGVGGVTASGAAVRPAASKAAGVTGTGNVSGGGASSNNNTATTAAAQTASAPGVAKDTITISALAGFSGNYGAILNKIYDNGFGTWVDDVNARGGINGRKVVAKKVDNKDTVEGGVAACKEVQNNGSYIAVSIVGFGGADVSAVDCLDHAGITTLAFNLSGFNASWKHAYSAGDAGKQTAPMASFIKDVIGDHGKIGVIHTDDPLNNAARGALVQAMQKLSMNLVHEETVAPNQASYVAELSHMQGAGATTVAMIVNTNEVLGILRDAKAIGYTPNWTGNYWVTDENSAAAQTVFQGIKAIRNYSSTNSPAFADYAAKAKQYGHSDVTNSTTMALYGMGVMVGDVLTKAGVNPTRDSAGTAIESMVNYNNKITMALSFGPGNHVAEVGMWPIQCCNGDTTWQGIGDAKSEF